MPSHYGKDPLKKMHDSAMKKLKDAGAAMKKYHTAAKKMHDSAMKMAHGKSPAKNKHYGKKSPAKMGIIGKLKNR